MLQHLAVVAGVHRRDAVHHDVVLAGAAEPRAAGRRAVCTTPGVNAVSAGEVVARRSAGSRSASVVTANDRSPLCVCTSGDSAVTVDGFGERARFERQRRNADAVAAADRDAAARFTVLNASSVTSTV